MEWISACLTRELGGVMGEIVGTETEERTMGDLGAVFDMCDGAAGFASGMAAVFAGSEIIAGMTGGEVIEGFVTGTISGRSDAERTTGLRTSCACAGLVEDS